MRKRLHNLGALGVGVWLWSTPATAAPSPNGWTLVWGDEFNGAALDASKWGHWLLGARRDAVNTAGAVAVTNGALTISTYTSGGTHYTGMISTSSKYYPDYGYLEARVDYNGMPGMWSAFWMQSPTMGNPIGDPQTAGTEIDICEHRKANSSGGDISDTVVGNIHWDGYGASHKSTGYTSSDLGLASGYHVYGLEWTPDVQRFYIDGALTWTVNNASGSPVSQRSEFIILSSEVEDASWAGSIPAGGYGPLTNTAAKMIVDYVRVYKRAETVVNGDFEGRAAPFGPYGGAAWSSTGGRSGAALLLAPSSSAAGAEQPLFGLVPDADYVLTGWGDANGYSGFSLGVKNHGGSQVGQSFSGGSYQKASIPFTTGASSTGATVFAYASVSGSVVYADDILLRRAASANNAQLESGDFSPWTHYGDTTVARDGNAYGGDWALKFAAGASSAGAEQEFVGLQPNTTYRFGGWTKNGGQGLNLGVKNYAAAGSQVSTTVAATNWARGSVTFKTGATNTTATAFAWRASSASAAYADAFFLCEPLPAAWTNQDVTAIPLAGAAGRLGDKFVVQASGADIWNSADKFHFVYLSATGDVQVTARVLALDGTHAAAKAGVMIRQSLSSGAPSAMINCTPGGSLEFIRRASSGGTCASTSRSGVSAPAWLSLIRRGGSFSAYWSKDGAAWLQLGTSQTISMTAAAVVGLATCSHDESLLTEAVFADVAAGSPPVCFTNEAAGAWSAAPWEPTPPGMTVSGSATVNVFNNAAPIASTNDLGAFTLNQLRFASRAVALSGGALTFDGAAPAFAASQNEAHAIANPLALSQTTTFDVAAGTTTLAGAVSGGGGLTKSGGGALALPVGNSFSGPATVITGLLAVSHASALGAAGGGVVVSNGGYLGLSGSITVSGESATLFGAGNYYGALQTVSGTNAWSGTVLIGAEPTRVGANAGQLTISGAIGDGANAFGLIVRNNTGTTVLSGTNTYQGPTSIYNGPLAVSSLNRVSGGTPSSGLGAPTNEAAGTIHLGTAALTGTLVYTGGGSEATDRCLNLAGTTGGGALDQSGSGVLTFTHAVTATGAGSKTLTLQGSSKGSGVLAGAIADNAPSNRTSVLKAGTGTWTLAGTNSHTGATILQGGVLAPTSDRAFGAVPAAPSPGRIVLAGGTLEVTSSWALASARGVALAGTSTLSVAASAALSYGGVLAGTGTVVKAGGGALALSGANTFRGSVRVDAGALRLGAPAALSTNVAVNVASNAVFDVGETAQALAGLSGAGSLAVAASASGAACGGVSVSGALALGQLRLSVAGLSRLRANQTYVVAACPPGFLSGAFCATNVERPWTVRYEPAAGRALLACSPATMLLLH
jgi:autotransporter-associated beta strand protein